MASPISFTIELSRCWTTDRVMGSILVDILALLFLELADDPIYIRIRHRGRQSTQSGSAHVYRKNTTVPMISTAAMNNSTAGNPSTAATTPVVDCISAAPRKNARLIADSALP